MRFFRSKPSVVTHSGSFHPDDVCAVAVLDIYLKGKYRLVRTRDEEIIKKADYVVDVGGIHDPANNRFDHHQKGGAGKRYNGIPYASFGLVWKEYGSRLCGHTDIAEEIDRNIVCHGDAIDNGMETVRPIFEGVTPYTLINMISSFNPSWNEDADIDNAFCQAVCVAVSVLKREIKRARAKKEGLQLAKMDYEKAADKRIIELRDRYPWREYVSSQSEPLYVVYEGGDSQWKVSAVPTESFSFQLRKPLPASWAGLSDEELVKVSGVPDAKFCHNGLFMAVARSREGALALANKALEA